MKKDDGSPRKEAQLKVYANNGGEAKEIGMKRFAEEHKIDESRWYYCHYTPITTITFLLALEHGLDKFPPFQDGKELHMVWIFSLLRKVNKLSSLYNVGNMLHKNK